MKAISYMLCLSGDGEKASENMINPGRHLLVGCCLWTRGRTRTLKGDWGGGPRNKCWTDATGERTGIVALDSGRSCKKGRVGLRQRYLQLSWVTVEMEGKLQGCRENETEKQDWAA